MGYGDKGKGEGISVSGSRRLLWASDDQTKDTVPVESFRLELHPFDGSFCLVPFDANTLGKGSGSMREALISGDTSSWMSAGDCGLSGRGSLISSK